MERLTIGNLTIRAFQIIFALIVLGLSAHLNNVVSNLKASCESFSGLNCNAYGWVPSTAYGVFVGAWGLVEGALGLAAIFVSAIPWIAVIAFDGLALVFYFAGAIRFAVLLSDFGNVGFGPFYNDTQADDAFMWLGFLLTIGAIVLVFFARRGNSDVVRSSTV